MAADTRQTAVAESSVQLAGAANTRLSFVGPPRRLTGDIPLINETDTKLRLRSTGLKLATPKAAAGLPLGEAYFFARLYPGEQANVPAAISLDPSTPPGHHQFELTIGKRTIAVDAHVEEVVDLRVEPSQISILAGSETTYARTLILENAGNVDLPIGAESIAPVYDSQDIRCVLVPAINQSDRSSLEAMLRNMLQSIGDVQAGTLVARHDPIVLHPGQKLTVDVSFNLPGKLKRLHHYFAHLQLYNARVSVDIYSTENYGPGSTTRSKAKETAS